MTPGQARIALLSFLLVTTGVAVNALFLQARPAASSRPAKPVAQQGGATEAGRRKGEAARGDKAGPRWPGSSSADSPLRIARFAPDQTRIDGAADAPRGAPNANTVAAIQRELDARGYGPLSGDGVLGIGTRAAIMAFEHDSGLALTGEASEALLKRILFGAAAAPEPAGAAKGKSSEAEQVILAVQKGLVTLGYQVARVDGRLGEDTVKAIRDFEVDKGLVPKGRVSAELLARITEATAPRPPVR
jgi:peptidoglycan hydrolase-like protein with peptidoglycan-binding domain